MFERVTGRSWSGAHLALAVAVFGVAWSAILVRWSTAPSVVKAFYRVVFTTVLLLPWALGNYRSEFREMQGRDLLVAALTGVALAIGLTELQPTASDALGVTLPEFPLGAAVGLAFGAMVGDIAASFLKRRTGRERGAVFPVVDQLDFVAGALLCALLLAPDWFLATFTLPVLAVVLVATPILHVLTNGIAYLLGLKNEPW